MMAPMAASFIAPMASSLINSISGKGIVRLRKGQEGGFPPLLAFTLNHESSRKRVVISGGGYNNMDHMNKTFNFDQYCTQHRGW